eukprot:scaffold381_cov138-Cylindrotheca_fusiformis.AAC.7
MSRDRRTYSSHLPMNVVDDSRKRLLSLAPTCRTSMQPILQQLECRQNEDPEEQKGAARDGSL